MTTSHRPQLEARSGAKGASYVPTGTQHARLLPGHTKLKLRSKRSEQAPDDQGSKAQYEDASVIEDYVEEEDGEEEEEEDDQEALLQELNRIRQERKEAKSNQKDVPTVKIEDGIAHASSASNDRPSWRRSTTFGRNKVGKAPRKEDDEKDKYQNSLLKSKYHQDFMRRYVR